MLIRWKMIFSIIINKIRGVPVEMTVKVRKAGSEDMPLLREILYEAIFIREGEEKPDPSIIDNPDIFKYLSGWMKNTDTGFIAETGGQAVGAAWARLFESAAAGGYGFINSDTPELCLANITVKIFPEHTLALQKFI